MGSIWKGKITPPVDVQSLAAAHDPRCYFDVVGAGRVELPASWTRTMRATNCATPRCYYYIHIQSLNIIIFFIPIVKRKLFECFG